jgi:hypothetical protein
MKNCSTPLNIRDIQIKTTVRYHFTPDRVVGIKKIKVKYCPKCGAPVHYWWE